MIWYALLKLIHVLAAVTWIGGVTAVSTINGRLIRAGDRATLAGVFPHALAYMEKMAGPSAILVLLTGIPMVILEKIGFGTFWVTWGFMGILVHFGFGFAVMRPRTMEFAQLIAANPPDDARIAAAGARLRVGNLIYLLIMVSVIGAMVLKPVL